MAKKISYYDLLNMVKNNEYPSVYYNCSNGAKILYKPEFDDVDNSFLCYMLKNNKEYNEEYARHYLAENILESEMFKNNLEIKEEIEKTNCQTSLIPPWFKDKELIKIVNENFGDTEVCYETDTKLICKVPTKVKQFYKK